MFQLATCWQGGRFTDTEDIVLMTSDVTIARYTVGEEIANCITHGIGALLSIAALAVLTVFASRFGDAWHIVGCSVFGASLVLLYTASTLYHGIQRPSTKQLLQLLDHAGIFILIAGTYTPFTLVNLRGQWGWPIFAVIWSLAFCGILFQVTLIRKWSSACVGLYIVMGWLIVIAAKPLLESVAPGGLALLAAGGISYTGGVVFYAWKDLPYHHAIWHLFVLAGSAFHFFAVLFYVIPIAAVA